MKRLPNAASLARRAPLLLLLLTPAALAHEFWLETPRLRLAPNETTTLQLLVGDNFSGQPWPGRATKILRLTRYGPTPTDTADLAPADSLRLRIARPGLHTMVLQSANSFSELPAADFNKYLQTEGLDFILEKRREAGTTAQPGREAYRRCAKTLVQVGPASAAAAPADTAFRRVLGWPLELVPEQNPYRLKGGAALTVRVLRAGLPVAGALVQAWERQPGGLSTRHFSLHTNKSGRLLLRLSGPGPYLLASVRMVPTPRPAPANIPPADWLSTWASLTFAGPAAPLAARP